VTGGAGGFGVEEKFFAALGVAFFADGEKFFKSGALAGECGGIGTCLGGLDGDEPARAVIEAQDREIAEKSGLPPLRIKSLARVGSKK
jgi:hypothetical protein